MIPLKSKREIDIMRKSGLIVGEVLKQIKKLIRPGVRTIDLDRFAEDLIKSKGSRPAFKDYKGYPSTICASINEEIVHGIPGNRTLKKGDIITVDVGAELEGYFADAAFTYAVDGIDDESERLMRVTKTSLEKALQNTYAGKRISDISCAIQEHVESNGFNVIRAFVGHGIGSHLHELPEIPNFGIKDTGPRLENGMVLAIEPMVSAGSHEAKILQDGWTAVTADKSRVAHFEHTIAITEEGPEVLTLCQKKNVSK